MPPGPVFASQIRTSGRQLAKEKASLFLLSRLLRWWSMRDLNPRPPQCECGALSAELIPHSIIIPHFRRIN